MSTNPWVLHVKSVAQAQNLSYRDAMKVAKLTYKKKQEGGRANLLEKQPKKVSKFLDTHGDETIESLTVCRRPIQGPIRQILSAFTLGKSESLMAQRSYDELYHLYLLVKTSKGTYIVEKSSRVHFSTQVPHKTDETECISVPLEGKKLDLSKMMENLHAKGDIETVYRYSAHKDNCQRFIIRLLDASGLLTPSSQSFILQEVIDLIPDFLKSLGMLATDIASFLDIVQSGGKK